MNKTTLSVVGGSMAYLYSNEIKELVVKLFQYIMDRFTSKLMINSSGNAKIIYAIKEELTSQYQNTARQFNVQDGVIKPNYKLPNGSYSINHNNKTLHITVTDDNIEIMNYSTDVNTLKSFVNDIYAKFGNTDNVLLFYLSEQKDWKCPIFRRPRTINNITPDMRNLLNDVNTFCSPAKEQEYETNSRPYRKGYMIAGLPGTGKSTIVEKIAIDHNMPVYMVNLNADGMTDSVLINLLASVPMKSVILFDEMDKQYTAMQNNRNISLSNGGILSAIDGPQRLSHGTVVIMIVNDINVFDNTFRTQLIRPGRIDGVFTFTQII